jgi:hypothetical protein
MRIRVERAEGERFSEALEELLPREPYLAYANFPPLARGEGAVFGLYRGRFQAAASALGVLVARDAQDRALAAVCLEHRPFESAHFGISMAKIEAPLAVPEEEERLLVLRALYRSACAELRERGYRHLAALASTQDRVTCWALQEVGAFHVGTKISWMQSLTGRSQKQALPPPLRIEVYGKDAIARLDPRHWQRLYEWSGKAFDRGPYVFDLAVPRDQAMAIYQVWTQKALTGEWTDVLLVVHDREEIVAFHTMMVLEDLSEAAGVRILGRGIGGTLPGYRGLFTALQKETAAVRPLGAAFLENETQTSTIQSINVFGKLGHHCLRSTATFHMSLDTAARRSDSGVSHAR